MKIIQRSARKRERRGFFRIFPLHPLPTQKRVKISILGRVGRRFRRLGGRWTAGQGRIRPLSKNEKNCAVLYTEALLPFIYVFSCDRSAPFLLFTFLDEITCQKGACSMFIENRVDLNLFGKLWHPISNHLFYPRLKCLMFMVYMVTSRGNWSLTSLQSTRFSQF